MELETLDTPLLLVAMPQVGDPFFNRSVVLLLEHTKDGSFGLIVNRPLELTIKSVIGDLGVAWKGDEDAVVYLGGPVQPTAGITLFDSSGTMVDRERVRNIAPGVDLANDTETLKLLATEPPTHVRLFVGYAGWVGGQLEEELTRNDWLIAPLDSKLLFADDPSMVWNKALESIGVRPESLPSWAVPDNDDKGN